MNTIIFSLPNPPTMDFYQKKLALNEEFQHKAKIQGLVSYIYYPSQREHPCIGHAELEIEGQSQTLMFPSEFKAKPLSKMISSSLSENGFPFFRFSISVTPNQLQDLRINSPKTFGLWCAMGVAKALSRQGKYSIPLPVVISPLLSALYLTSARIFGSKRISHIEFYGIKNFEKGIFGALCEGCATFGYLLSIAKCINICAMYFFSKS